MLHCCTCSSRAAVRGTSYRPIMRQRRGNQDLHCSSARQHKVYVHTIRVIQVATSKIYINLKRLAFVKVTKPDHMNQTEGRAQRGGHPLEAVQPTSCDTIINGKRRRSLDKIAGKRLVQKVRIIPTEDCMKSKTWGSLHPFS